MRDIKFRVWLVEDKKMINFCRGEGRYDYALIWHEPVKVDRPALYRNSCLVQDQEYMVMEYTGLKDKDGKEIYEGDIIQYNFPQGAYAEVKFGAWDNNLMWDEHEFGYGWYVEGNNLRPTYLDDRPLYYDKKELSITVIGNKYEQPKLMGARL
jgi:uncharacterized phage protein (TIGR01671 family)